VYVLRYENYTMTFIPKRLCLNVKSRVSRDDQIYPVYAGFYRVYHGFLPGRSGVLSSMINLADNEILLRCSCHSLDHIAFLIHDPNIKGEHDDWYLSVMLDHFSFWKRVRKAFQYVFAPHTIRYGMSAELVLRSEDVDRLSEFIQKRRSL
jgi:hypothetical protein